MRRIPKFLMLLFVAAVAHAGPRAAKKPAPAGPPGTLQRVPDGAVLHVGDGFVKLEVCAADIVRVAYAKDQGFFARKTLVAQPRRCDGGKFELTQDAGTATLTTSKLRARVDLATGRVSFLDSTGAPVLEEKEG